MLVVGKTGTTRSLGMFASFGYRLSLQDRARLIKGAGFDSATAWWGEEDELYRVGRRDEIPAIIRGEGLFLENIHVSFDYCNDLWNDDSGVRDSIVRQHLEWLDDCARLSIPLIVIHITKGRPAFAPNRAGIESLARIVAAAEDRGVTVAVENTRSMEHLMLVFSEIQSPRLGFCYDSSHDWLHSVEKTSVLREFGDRLVAVHLADNDGSVDRHWLPGLGVVDWEAVARAFPKGYRGVISLEVFSRRTRTRETAAEFVTSAYEKAVWLAQLVNKARSR